MSKQRLKDAPAPPSNSIAARIREERIRIGISLDGFCSACNRSRTSQQFYEAGVTDPNADYLLAASIIGADINYIVTGTASSGTDKLSWQERDLIEGYRASDKSVRAFAVGGMSCVLAAKLLLDDSSSSSAVDLSITGETMAERIRDERVRLRMNQRELAQKLGVSKDRVSRFESGKLAPKALDLQALDTLGIDVTYVVCGYFLTSLSKEEVALISYYKLLPREIKRAVNAALSFKEGTELDL